ncbi:cofac_haem_bdg domain-containing protein [Haematococcus lacustris]|uniref:Cofac_haem_bdg domain-containing protein n=1 Tax=Haematococcus lacustris TaxID=44745 RepID=A0A699ZNB3_HAELA|nr:cofac_haem_bdg domain-containing protein [Haematococcus lacustris]
MSIEEKNINQSKPQPGQRCTAMMIQRILAASAPCCKHGWASLGALAASGAAGAAAYAEGPGPNNEPAHVAAAPSTNSAPSRAHYVEGTSFKAYTREGVPVTLHQVASAMQQHDVVLLGEYHDDPVAHHCQLRLWKAALRLCGLPPVAATGHVGRVLPPPWQLAHPHSGEGGAVRPTTSSDPAGAREPGLVRPAVLSLEMFETDTQVVMDEFLKGIVREQDLVVDGRAWPNYMRDYRPLVLAAKQHGAGVAGELCRPAWVRSPARPTCRLPGFAATPTPCPSVSSIQGQDKRYDGHG